MKVSSNIDVQSQKQNTSALKADFVKKISADEVKEIKTQIRQNVRAVLINSINIQVDVINDDFATNYKNFQSFLEDIGYDEGKSIADLSQEEAAKLVSEDGIFGIKQTSQRIANFVINGAGGDEDLLRAGREGMLQGFKEAEKLWGEELPDISQQTMQKAIEMVDNAMIEAGFSVIDTAV